MDLKLPDRFEPDELGMDELVLENVELVHLERRDDGTMWCCFYRGRERFIVWLTSRGKIQARAEREPLPAGINEQIRLSDSALPRAKHDGPK